MRIITCNNKWNNGIHWIRKITYDKIAMYNGNVQSFVYFRWNRVKRLLQIVTARKS